MCANRNPTRPRMPILRHFSTQSSPHSGKQIKRTAKNWHFTTVKERPRTKRYGQIHLFPCTAVSNHHAFRLVIKFSHPIKKGNMEYLSNNWVPCAWPPKKSKKRSTPLLGIQHNIPCRIPKCLQVKSNINYFKSKQDRVRFRLGMTFFANDVLLTARRLWNGSILQWQPAIFAFWHSENKDGWLIWLI